jgi:hypothetical protein
MCPNRFGDAGRLAVLWLAQKEAMPPPDCLPGRGVAVDTA